MRKLRELALFILGQMMRTNSEAEAEVTQKQHRAEHTG